MTELRKLLKEVPNSDCTVLLGDFNEQLPSGVNGLTGKWGHDKASPHADAILDTMRMFNLCAANTYFKPKKNCNNTTYLAPKTSDEISTAGQQYVGRRSTVCGTKGVCKVQTSLLSRSAAWDENGKGEEDLECAFMQMVMMKNATAIS